ncbi:hypothetical protein SERLA73DRAFT_117654 [Serpula lacrymans var. lacrymans S7.3]|uniref:RhoGAP-domain-containing protein n=1 Tax=Serpula lacrymans var. lacrymans (strain S7.3) TaxID=936435 RepID=F8QHM3_SERL3|nr:hypothetical protein SERLA73DRAFT_117654 [Serpula lacrymans var. lacrymans S7.3]
MTSKASVAGTPSRERHPTSSSQLTASPIPMRTTASSSTSSLVTSSTAPTTSPITLEAILAAHANAPNPFAAALEQALSERNVFSTQNTQLWKLIEKQRSGYSQVLKELERVRNERDTFKARLQAAGLSDELPKREKERERDKSLRSSASNSTMASTSISLNGSANPKATMARQQSDDVATPRNNNHQFPTAPSQEPLPTRDSAVSPPTHTQKSSRPHFVPPLVVPPRKTSLASTTTSSPDVPSSADVVSSMSTSALSETPPWSQQGSSESPPTMSNGAMKTTPPVLVAGQTALVEYATPSLSIERDVSLETSSTSTSSRTPSLQSSTVPPNSTLYPPPSSGSSLSLPSQNPVMLSPIVEHRGPSRDSRVSLPDEAKRYIANMGESPVPSPKLSGFGSPRASPDPQGRQALASNASDNASSASLALDKSSSRRDHADKDPVPEDTGAAQFLDLGDEGEDEEVDEKKLISPDRRGIPRSPVEDFPLPPSHGPMLLPNSTQLQAHLMTPTQAHPHLYPTATPPAHLQSHMQAMAPDSPVPSSYLNSQQPATTQNAPTLSFRALPLVFEDLKTTRVSVSHSSIRANDRGKEVLSFIIELDPGNRKEPWRVEKLYSDVLGLDQRMRMCVAKGVVKKIGNLPEGKLWRDHAPAKVDQRKVALEVYLQTLIDLPVKNKDEVIAFFTSDIVRDTRKPVSQAGYKEGYLTKRGKNFGGWKTRYFVLQGPVLEYYESRGGAHLGSITITGAQIGRQQRSGEADEEKDYRHAFLIIEAKRGPGGSHPRHVLCAESDADRDSWVEVLVRYVLGSYNEEPNVSSGPSPISVNVGQTTSFGSAQPRSSTSSTNESVTTPNGKRPIRAIPPVDDLGSSSPVKSINQPSIHHSQSGHFTAEDTARRILERGQPSNTLDAPLSSSLPTSSPLESATTQLAPIGQRANSELGHYPDLQDRRAGPGQQESFSPEQHRTRDPRRDRKSFHPTLGAVGSSPPRDRAPSPDVMATPVRGDPNGQVKISGPLGGAPIPMGYKFGGKDAPSESAAAQERREKAKSRSFWGFGRPNGVDSQADKMHVAHVSRAVFGIPLEESLEVAEIARLPAVVFRSIQYLEAKKAEQEEGIYRLSGSSAVIKSLKDRFNTEGDVDLLSSDEYWDPHAIAGLLKSFLRELPASILTRELHLKFLDVINFLNPQERIKELSQLIAALPIANYSLLRALTAHLILIVQNSNTNKMTMRNVGIVFSPTLGIPAGVFSLMLGEFNRVFNVDAVQGTEDDESSPDHAFDVSRRNSRQYLDAAADQLLGLSGRSLKAPPEETPSDDGDSVLLPSESGNDTTENDATVDSSHTRSSAGVSASQHVHHQQSNDLLFPPSNDGLSPNGHRSHASNVAASRGLNIAISKKGNRHSRVMGLPVSPRPAGSPMSPAPSLQTAKQG